MATFNFDTLKDQTLAQLGIESVPVEAGEQALNACMARTIEVLGRYKPNIRHDSYVSQTGITVHPCQSDVQGIRSIDMVPTNAGTIGTMNIESAMMSGQPVFYSTTDTYLDIQYFDERLRWLKMAQRVLSSDQDYEYVRDPETGVFSIYTFATVPMWVDVSTVIPYHDNADNIPMHLQNWVAEYFKAEVMEVVSQVRSKFVKIPVAGTFMEMNGPQLSDKAKKKKDELLEFIQGSRADLFPRWC